MLDAISRSYVTVLIEIEWSLSYRISETYKFLFLDCLRSRLLYRSFSNATARQPGDQGLTIDRKPNSEGLAETPPLPMFVVASSVTICYLGSSHPIQLR